MFAEGGTVVAAVDDEASPEEEGALVLLESTVGLAPSSFCLSEGFEPGVEAALSSVVEAFLVTSDIILSRSTGPAPLECETSEELTPVLARLDCFVSLSEGERDLLRFVSASGMANFSLNKCAKMQIWIGVWDQV